MHDFLLAKEIVDEVLAIAAEKKLTAIKSVDVEIGTIALAHDGFDEHTEDIDVENLQFGLENIAKNTILKNTEFKFKKVSGDNWKITNIEI
ncbi:MAG: hypothetical protein Q7T51_02730 [Candidatus Moranbacteria bacterium]|nr:hypothetical protein [Candidatus Moranbacteria bacterium]